MSYTVSLYECQGVDLRELPRGVAVSERQSQSITHVVLICGSVRVPVCGGI